MKRDVVVSLLDQALLSAFNLVLNFAFITVATPAEFGRFAFVQAASFFAISAQNALVIMPLNYLLPGRPRAAAEASLALMTSANLALTAVALAAALALGLPIGADAVLSAGIVGYVATVTTREYVRNVLVVTGRIGRTLLYDAVAIVASAGLAVLLWQVLAPEAAALLGLTGGNLVAFLVCRVDLKFDPARLGAHLAGYRPVWRDTRWALQGALQNEVAARSYVFLVERLRDAAALGALNAGRVAVSPLLLVATAWVRVARPRLVADLARGGGGVRRLALAGAALVVAAALVYGVALRLAWPLIEAHVLRGRYGDMAPIVAGWWLYALFVGLTSAATVVLEARRQFRALAIVGLASAALIPVVVAALLATGAGIAAVVMALAAVALGEAVVCAVLAARRPMPAPPAAPPATSPPATPPARAAARPSIAPSIPPSAPVPATAEAS